MLIKELLRDGYAKRLYSTDDPDYVVIQYKDTISAYHGVKKANIPNKGVWVNKISEYIFLHLEKEGIKTIFAKSLDEHNQLCKNVTIFPLEFMIRNVIAGSLSLMLDLEEGIRPESPIFEIYIKNHNISKTLINDDHAVALQLINHEDLNEIHKKTLKINQIICDLFDEVGIDVINIKMEFGYDKDHNLVLADEISPDSCRFWDKQTKKRLDRDRFKRELGMVEESYREVWERLTSRNNK